MTFDTAQSVCTKANGTLACIADRKEQDFLAHLLFEAYKVFDNTWVGALRINGSKSNKHAFEWIDGTPFQLHPLVAREYQGKWFDFQCSAEHSFVCQKYLALGGECLQLRRLVRFDVNSVLVGLSAALLILLITVYYFAEFSAAKRLLDDFVVKPETRSSAQINITTLPSAQ
ncbi:hypothetical protein HDE_05402 [Halotydeus destructor]|nr:hypothetical protein HDE_05402 [Halotydeus destructor]